MATIFTTTPTSLSGDVYSTSFVHTLASNYNHVVWSFGDGSFAYGQQSVSHSYDFPGTYQVSVTAGNYDSPAIIDQTTVTADFVYRDAIVFTQLPAAYGMAGQETATPFVISLTSSKVDEPVSVCLYAHGSNSVPYFSVPEKWNFIIPKWKFVDAETKEPFSDSVLIDTTPLYKDSTVVGVSGQLSFFYIDDSSSGVGTENESPILLVATLSTENFTYPQESRYYSYKGFANPKNTKASVSWHINEAPVTNYKITENYLNEIYPVKWKNVPIPVMITCQFQPPYEGAEKTDVLGYPYTNENGLLNPINLTLFENGLSVDSNFYEVESPLYFKSKDDEGNIASGYIFTTVTPLTTFAGEMQIGVASFLTNQVLAEGTFAFPYGYPIYSQTFVSNPYHSNINVIALYNYNFSPSESQLFNVYAVDVPTLSSVDVRFNEISGTAAVYGLSFNPYINRLYGIDADQDTLMSFDPPTYNLVNSVSLSSINNIFPSVPSYISIDGNNDMWVSLFNSHQLLKLDKDMNYLLSAVPTVPIPYDTLIEGSPAVASTVVETDQDNNVWATYSHPTSSMLIKYDSQGTQLFRVNELPLTSVPVSMAIDPYKNVWVCNYNTSTIDLYDATDGHMISSVDSGFIHPSYLSLDMEANVWFTHGYNFLSKYDVRTYQLSTWKFENGFETITVHNEPYDAQEQYEALQENEVWSGLGIDVYNRIWIVDKEHNKIGVFKNINPLSAFVTDLTPSVSPLTATSGQVAGDWTGNRWYQKYAQGFSNVNINDTSVPFRIYDIDDFQIAKVNETFDFAGYMKSLALPEHMATYTQLFEGALKSIVGDSKVSEESLGRVSYERVANFLDNHSDIETSEIKQLLSYAKQTSVNAKTFGVGFPAAVMRLLNLFSVSKQRLRGTVMYSDELDYNIKELLTTSSLITANELLVAKDKRYNKYQLIVVSPLETSYGTTNVYPLSSIELKQLRSPLFDNYYFHRYEEDVMGYKGNLIDWESPYTTISFNLSTAEQWYGDDGLLEKAFNSLLTKQLFLE